MKRARPILTLIFSIAFAAMAVSPESAVVRGLVRTEVGSRTIGQSSCPLIFPSAPVVVAPNQPSVANQSTVGIINALCDVTLDFIGCEFLPTSVILSCDANGDGVSDLSIPLKNITVISGVFFQATIPALASTPGTAFPLACCGGKASITLSRTVGAGDDNAFGPFTQTITCSIDLGIRAPVVISATPSEGDCATGQNILIPGSCFVLAGGKPNVTSVFAVERSNPNNVIQANPVSILNNNIVDAFFQIGASNAGKTFLIYASGPNGTSRNLTLLPAGAPTGCPLGNEQGVAVTFKCKPGTPGIGDTCGELPLIPHIISCSLDRDSAGAFFLTINGTHFLDGLILTVGGVTPRKIKLQAADPGGFGFTRIVARGKVCTGLPGDISIFNQGHPCEAQGVPFLCAERCSN